MYFNLKVMFRWMMYFHNQDFGRHPTLMNKFFVDNSFLTKFYSTFTETQVWHMKQNSVSELFCENVYWIKRNINFEFNQIYCNQTQSQRQNYDLFLY